MGRDMSDLISVLIPVYNGEIYLPKCLNSIAEQTYKGFEIVIVDDGSVDRTIEICEEFINAHPQIEIKLIVQNHLGVSAARNRAFAEANGELVAFIDSDDMVVPEYLQILYDAMLKHRVDMVCCGVKQVDNSGNTTYIYELNPYFVNRVLDTKESVNASLIFNIRHESWGCLVNRELYIRNKIQYPEGRFYEDLIPTLELIMCANGIYIVEEYMYLYRNTNTGTVSTALTNPQILFDKYTAFYEYANAVEGKEINRVFFSKAIVLWLGFFRTDFFEYQDMAYRYSIISGKADYSRKMALYGAGQIGIEYVKLNQKRFDNYIFIDRDPLKKSILNYPIVSLDEYIESYSKEYKVLLTNRFIFSVAEMLLKHRVIEGLEQLMLYNGEYQVEKQLAYAFSLCLKLFDKLESASLRKEF